jgi:hypothetical protein
MAVLDEFDKRNYRDENGEPLRVHYPEETFGKDAVALEKKLQTHLQKRR